MSKRKGKAESAKEASLLDESVEVRVLSPEVVEAVEKAISRMRVITPYSVASSLKIPMSTAKKALRALEEKGVVSPVVKSWKIVIYARSKGG
uniref:Ribosomal protein S25 n=1 Tax=uncultured korarchaeote TaxID=161241 RepID=A0A1L2JM59_9CREN|nr:ribosomal protein S25 [uncultured korarchaeote]